MNATSSNSCPPSSAARKVRLLLVDVHDISRRSFRQLLDAIGIFEIVGDTGDTTEAMSLAENRLPDVVLMSVRVRGSSGIEMTRRFRAMPHAPKVVMLTLYDSPEYIQETARAGANGYVLKEAPVEQLLEAIDAVLQGKTYSSPGLPPLENIKS